MPTAPPASSPVRKPMLDTTRCTTCGVCVVACPQGAIAMTSQRRAGRTIVAPTISERCVACGLCVEVCPSNALTAP